MQITIDVWVSTFFLWLTHIDLQFPSKQRVTKLRVPMLFLSGMADTLIPPRMMLELYNVSGSVCPLSVHSLYVYWPTWVVHQ